LIIPDFNLKIRFSRPALYGTPLLKFEVEKESDLTRKIERIKANSLAGFLKRNSRENYTSLTLDSKGFFKSRKVKVLVKNKDLKKLIGRLEFQRLQSLDSSSDRFAHLKNSFGPLNPLDGRRKLHKGSSPSEWQTLSLEINRKLKALFPELESDDIKKVRRAVNKMIVSKDSSIFGLVDVTIKGKKEQIFLRKRKGELFLDQPKPCGDGGTATVYKVHGYALKKFRPVTEIDPITDTPIVSAKNVKREMDACKDVETIPGTLKIKAELKDMESNRLIGYVMRAYDGDFGDYLLSSHKNPSQLCKHFTKLAGTFAQMHAIDKVHTDIKIDNVFANFDQKGVNPSSASRSMRNDPKFTL
jgi:hypothetical protein